jgi:hypothetical protein
MSGLNSSWSDIWRVGLQTHIFLLRGLLVKSAKGDDKRPTPALLSLKILLGNVYKIQKISDSPYRRQAFPTRFSDT